MFSSYREIEKFLKVGIYLDHKSDQSAHKIDHISFGTLKEVKPHLTKCGNLTEKINYSHTDIAFPSSLAVVQASSSTELGRQSSNT